MGGCRWGIWPHACQAARAACTHVLCSPTYVYGHSSLGTGGRGAQPSVPPSEVCPTRSLGDRASRRQLRASYLQRARAMLQNTRPSLHRMTWVKHNADKIVRRVHALAFCMRNCDMFSADKKSPRCFSNTLCVDFICLRSNLLLINIFFLSDCCFFTTHQTVFLAFSSQVCKCRWLVVT